MLLKTYLNTYGIERTEQICEVAGTNLANYRHIMNDGSVGRHLAERLALATDGEVTELEILYSKRYST